MSQFNILQATLRSCVDLKRFTTTDVCGLVLGSEELGDATNAVINRVTLM